MADTWREADLRKEYIDSAVKAVNKEQETLKTLCIIDTSSAWTESYYRETNSDATDGGTGSAIKNIPQMAPFPFLQVTETKVSNVVMKYGGETIISLEMQSESTVPMLERHLMRIPRQIQYQINVVIEALMSGSAGNTFAVTAGNEWDSATEANRNPVYDLMYGVNMMRADGVDALNGNGYLVVNGTDFTNIVTNKNITNHPTFTSVSVVENGVVAHLCGLKIMVNDAVTADQAYIVAKGQSLVWKQAQALTVTTIVDPGKSTTVRAWERGVPQLHQTNGICKITNTRK